MRQQPTDVTPPGEAIDQGRGWILGPGRGSPRALMVDAFGLVLQEALTQADNGPCRPHIVLGWRDEEESQCPVGGRDPGRGARGGILGHVEGCPLMTRAIH